LSNNPEKPYNHGNLEKFDSPLSPGVEDALNEVAPLLIPYRSGEKHGFCNVHKDIVIPCRYDLHRDVGPFRGGLGLVVKNQKFGFVDPTGYEAIPCAYVLARQFSEGLAPVCDGRKWGFINAVGNLIIPFKYENVFGDFSEGVAAVRYDKGDLTGYINHAGESVTDFDYNGVSCEFSEGLVCVSSWKGFSGYINNEGETVIPLKFIHGENFSNGLAKVSDNTRRYGFIDKKGEVVLPFEYYVAMGFSDERAAFKKDSSGGWGFIDKQGKVIIPAIYADVDRFSDGLARVCGKNGKWGFIDREGNMVAPFIYHAARNFSEGIAAVRLNGNENSWGAIDRYGKTVLPFQYDFVFDFKHGVVFVDKNRKYGYVGKDGAEYFDDKKEVVVSVNRGSEPIQKKDEGETTISERQAAMNKLFTREYVAVDTDERVSCAREWVRKFENRAECRRCLQTAEAKADFLLENIIIAKAWFELLGEREEAIRCILRRAETSPLRRKLYCREVVHFFIHELDAKEIAQNFMIITERHNTSNNRMQMPFFLKVWLEEFNDREQAVRCLKEHEKTFCTWQDYFLMSSHWSKIMKDEKEATRCREMSDMLHVSKKNRL